MAYKLSGIRKRFGELEVLGGIDLSIEDAELLVILGPSGCGKTTLLKIVAGLDRDHGGRREGFEEADFSFVFQDHRLLPWESAVGNALFALSGTALSREEALARIEPLVLRAGLAGHERRPVRELSGGMRQRASLVRAFSRPADLILLDEAFQSLDLRRKRELMQLFLDLRDLDGMAAILVTHDPWEALLLADRVIVLSDRPARIVDEFSIDLPRSRRASSLAEMSSFEQRLMAALW